MAVKFLDLTGLQKFWTKCKNTFVAKNATGDVSVSGDVSVGNELFVERDATIGGHLNVGGQLSISNLLMEVDQHGGLMVDGLNVATVEYVNSQVSNKASKTELTNAVKDLASKTEVNTAVSNATSNLATKTEVSTAVSGLASESYVNGKVAGLATESFVTAAVANAGHLKREKVSALPGVSTAKDNVIYMVPNSSSGNNKFDEYMLIDGSWEKTGSSDVDLSGYSTTAQMNTAISTAINNAHTAITETEINNLT